MTAITAIIIIIISIMRLLFSSFIIATIASSTAQQIDDLTRDQIALSGGLRALKGGNLVPRQDERRAQVGGGFDRTTKRLCYLLAFKAC
jgi:hypothetical protein